MLGSMSGLDVVAMMASASLDPEEEERADIRWAVQMETVVALTPNVKGSYPPLYWLQRLPWRDEFVSAEQRVADEAKRERTMAEFAKAYRERKAAQVTDG